MRLVLRLALYLLVAVQAENYPVYPKLRRAKNAIAGDYIVVFDQAVTSVAETLKDLHGIHVKSAYESLRMASIHVDMEKGVGETDDERRLFLLKDLLESNLVQYIEEVRLQNDTILPFHSQHSHTGKEFP